MKTIKKTLLAEDRLLAKDYEANTPKRRMALALRSLRKRAGLTQVQVAERTGLTQSHISKMEAANGSMPMAESLSKYADACGAEYCVVFPEKGAQAKALQAEQDWLCTNL